LIFGPLGLFLVAHFVHHLSTAIHVPLMPFIRADLGLDYLKAGALVSAFSVPYGLAQLPTGVLADRLGPRLVMSLGFLAMAVWAVAIGLSQNYWQLAVFLGILGICGGTYHPTAPSLISRIVPSKDRGRALGLHLAGGSTSFFLAPILAALLATAIGWRGAFFIVAVPTALAGLLIWRMIRPAEVEKSPASVEPTERIGVRRIVRMVGIFVGIGLLANVVSASIVAFFSLYLVDKHGLQLAHASMILAMVYGSGLIAAPIGGALSDRFGREPLIIAACLLTPVSVLLLTVAPFGVGFVLIAGLLGVSLTTRSAVIETLLMDRVPAALRASVLGVYFFLSMESSSIVTPGTGYLIDWIGADTTFRLLALVVLVATALFTVAVIWRRKRPVPHI
jgi:MFS family permease